MTLHTAWLVWALGCVPASAEGPVASDPAAGSAASKIDPVPAGELSFIGRIEPKNATKLLAVANFVRVEGWNNSGGSVQIEEIVDDGVAVKEGDVVVRFQMQSKDMLDWLQRRIRDRESQRTEADLGLRQELADLRVETARLELAAERARLETGKASVLSTRAARLNAIDHEIALFEAAATRAKLVSTEAVYKSEMIYQDGAVLRVRYLMTVYDRFTERFLVRAPHDGIVRYAFSSRDHRRVQKGDDLRSGEHVMSVAKDESLSVRFFVPEAQVGRLALGEDVTVLSPESKKTVVAKVAEIDPFPQEMGFLLEDENVPSAWEKAHAVVASLSDSAKDFAAGNQVQVRWRER
jgi:multidrug resistance efflux pump